MIDQLCRPLVKPPAMHGSRRRSVFPHGSMSMLSQIDRGSGANLDSESTIALGVDRLTPVYFYGALRFRSTNSDEARYLALTTTTNYVER